MLRKNTYNHSRRLSGAEKGRRGSVGSEIEGKKKGGGDKRRKVKGSEM